MRYNKSIDIDHRLSELNNFPVPVSCITIINLIMNISTKLPDSDKESFMKGISSAWDTYKEINNSKD